MLSQQTEHSIAKSKKLPLTVYIIAIFELKAVLGLDSPYAYLHDMHYVQT